MTRSGEGLIIGAGPYGLSLAAHLRAAGVSVRVFGRPMEPWRTTMPKGMFLKSEGFASTLFDPASRYSLETYCSEQGIPYADTGVPVEAANFIAYGEAFQRRFVPDLEDRTVARLERAGDGFEVTDTNGGTVHVDWVVIASGVTDYAYLPPVLRDLPADQITHSSGHHDYSGFAGRDVIVVGAGASAMDVAAALQGAGARARVVARRTSVRFQTALGTRSLMTKLRAPMTSIGPGWKSVACVRAPLLFRLMPDGFRTEVVRRYLGPAPGWFTRQMVEGNVPIETGLTLERAEAGPGGVTLTLRTAAGETIARTAEHVIAATGFQVDVNRLPFLAPALRSAIRTVEGAPFLSSHFETSVPGLYFTGPASANSFGPLLRFAAGAGFASRRLGRWLIRNHAPSRRAATRAVVAGPVMADG